MERTGSSENPMVHVQENYALIDSSDESNLAHFISLSRDETAHLNVNFCHNFLDCDHINVCLVDNQFEPSFGHPYDNFNIPPTTTFSNQHSHFNHLPKNCDVLKEALEDTREYSSGTMTTTSMPTKRSRKGDRSRTLIHEQKRRSRMKEKLYALRALVPNITKMDKASIVGDAALYVQDLQMQAKKLKAEVASLESSLTRMDTQQEGIHDNADKFQIAYHHPTIKIILQIGVYQLEENGYYVRVVSNKGHGVAASLYKALESLSTFVLQSSNLATSNDTFHLTFTLNVREDESDMNVPNLKLWVAAAFLNQGFDIPQSL
ncbi:transcription factor FER-LIKE IRON DEFICIENCY-INDUCED TRANSCRIPTION FACTOR-like [Heracleum sosnowskyi]|uniref:Transcription factor FER-LIKE IRON DEFICIENCY-INDUCED TRANSCRIPTION FACTOR-like n=1 Tax=Heracleum sosnowskyi TaxID=360622 RepID=A0AAD8H0K5_9APIA|nr:transcription factor FER-LIKE IRON DEFICIENCY-INDUCED TRANSCRIPTION FACTOR-like [Heracleum sosnowskyi]